MMVASWIVPLSLIAAGVSGSPAVHVFGETKTQWIIEMHTDKRLCTMASLFGPADKTGTYLMIIAGPALKDGLTMAIMNGSWRSILEGAKYELELQLNTVAKPWRLRAHGLNRNGWLGVGADLPNEFVEAFRSAKSLQVFYDNRKLDAFALRETKFGLELLSGCAFQLKYVLRPEDPFK